MISRSPIVSLSRRNLLRLVGLAPDTGWEKANSVLKDRIVMARNNGNDKDASYWSTIRDELETRLARTCECGATISAKSVRCLSCNSRQANRGSRTRGWWKHTTLVHHLGKYSDNHLGRVYGMHPATITRIRQRNGIPRYDIFYGASSYPRKKRDWPEAVLSKLGTMPDRRLANLFGLPKQSVKLERIKRNIPAFCLKSGSWGSLGRDKHGRWNKREAKGFQNDKSVVNSADERKL